MLLIVSSYHSSAQKQLVLLKGEEVMLRLKPGDDFVFRVKGAKEVRHTYINNLSDTSVVTHRDTIPYHRIDRVYFRRVTFGNRFGFILLVGGAGYFLIDQINNVIVHGNEAEIDRDVAVSSASLVAVGLPLMLIGRKYQKIRGRKRLLMATEESPFYRNQGPQGYDSPFIPR